MYTPTLRPDQIRQLYKLHKSRRRPMTKILRQIVDEYLKVHEEELNSVHEYPSEERRTA
jgi:hypothetical protein